MIEDNKTDAADSTELRDEDLEQAAGGLKSTPKRGGDPEDGGD